ncbi:hypothetical protein [Numidum massiliense]|nr:hypothetical protein [Numidum massiliense]
MGDVGAGKDPGMWEAYYREQIVKNIPQLAQPGTTAPPIHERSFG